MLVIGMTGIVTGLCAIVIVEGSSACLRWRNDRLEALIHVAADGEVSGLAHAFAFITLYSSALVLFAGCMVRGWGEGLGVEG